MDYILNEIFEIEEENDSSLLYIEKNCIFQYTLNRENSKQNDNQLLNVPYLKSIEAQSSLINNNIKKVDFQKSKIEINDKINKTREITYNLKNEESKGKEKKVIFKTENTDGKKIISQNKRRKIQEAKNSEKQNKSTHTKYAFDNILRRIKSIVLRHMMDFINTKIEEKYKNIGNGIKIKKLFIMEKTQVSKSKIDFNIAFMNKKLKEIFSENITTRNSNLPVDKNKILIEKLINEKDEEKRKYFNDLFGLTFLDCLDHFINKKFFPILQGLQLFNEIINDSEKSKKLCLDINAQDDYIDTLKYYLENYEFILRKKKSRKGSS
jgi:hypothetical protein